MDGLTATQTLRVTERERNWKRMPVLAVTADSASDSRGSCVDAGIDAVLEKPLNVARIESGLLSVLGP
jgi:CheY-like chemotaxis protein